MVLSAVTSDLSYPSFTSSASSIASVNVYGVITAKKAGKATISIKSKYSDDYVLKTDDNRPQQNGTFTGKAADIPIDSQDIKSQCPNLPQQ